MKQIKKTDKLKKGNKKIKNLSKDTFTKIYLLLGIGLIIFTLINIFQTSSISSLYNDRFEEAKELARPGDVDIIVLTANQCDDCYDISPVVDVIESTGVNILAVRDVDFSSDEAKSLIESYGIEKLPSVIVTGEISKTKALVTKFNDMGVEKNGAYIFTALVPPFVEASTGNVRGRISLISLIRSDCLECEDLTALIGELEASGLKFKEKREVDMDSSEGIELVTKYDIEKLPTIIMDKEAEVYSNIQQSWTKLGSVERNGDHIMRVLNPPYYSLAEDRVVGSVSMIVLKDKTCIDCYDPNSFHKPILQRMGVEFKDEKEVDANDADGKALIDKYKIEKIPTILLEGDMEAYTVLVNAWQSVGTEESDGTWVFRSVEVSKQPYRDLTTGEIVGADAQN